MLLSGGDPLLLSDEKLESLLSRLHAIPHVEFLRIGSRIPTFLPQRITPELCAMLKKFHPLFVSIHSNHPRELTTEVREAVGRLADAGIPLGNQSVLLKHVNDDPVVMKALVQKLLICRVKPYYLYQCDLIAGSAHLRASVSRGLEIMEQLRGHTTGYAVPQYVIDAPGGGGKVPINPEYVLCRNAGRVLIRNYEGKVFEYPEAPDGTPTGQPPKEIEETDLACRGSLRLKRKLQVTAGLLLLGALAFAVFAWHEGSVLIAPSNCEIGPPPSDLPVQMVQFPSSSGATIHGWLVSGAGRQRGGHLDARNPRQSAAIAGSRPVSFSRWLFSVAL